MEHVLAPNFKFKAKVSPDEKPEPGTLVVKGLKEPSTERTRAIVEEDLDDLKATVLQDPEVMRAIPGGRGPRGHQQGSRAEGHSAAVPGPLRRLKLEEVRQHVVADSAVRAGEITKEGDKRFIRMADKFVNIDDLHIDLIDRVNPFQKAYEILSKSVTPPVLKAIRDVIEASRIEMTEEEARILWPKINDFHRNTRATAEPLRPRPARAAVWPRRSSF